MSLRNPLPRLWLACAAASLPAAAFACPTEPIVGHLCMTAASFCPFPSYLPADGRLLPISNYEMLFNVIEDNYGGDGQESFALPDLNGRAPMGAGTGPGLSTRVQSEKTGWQEVPLNISQMPVHSHSASFDSGGGITVGIQASTSTSGNRQAPDASYRYLAGSPGGTPLGGSIWSSSAGAAPVALAGVTVSGSIEGTPSITLGGTGGGEPVPVEPPGLALTWCIAVVGEYRIQ